MFATGQPWITLGSAVAHHRTAMHAGLQHLRLRTGLPVLQVRSHEDPRSLGKGHGVGKRKNAALDMV